ncbi:MAG: molybdopterin-dependent oxidoreductase, partial [Rickettsiaceae bacterium]|nr:molybdopterin-dependent oxidoreductase [Rickettsiaceae bacterium]
TRGLEVMRILPRLNEDINEEWISDRIRFAYDGLKNQRIDSAYIKKGGRLTPVKMTEALSQIIACIKENPGSELGAIAGIMTDLETMMSMKLLMHKLGSNNIDYNQFGYVLDSSTRANYLFNSKYKGIEDADLLITIGCNIRKNAPVLGARISRLQKSHNLVICNIGHSANLPYNVKDFGDNLTILEELEDGKSEIASLLSNSKTPVLIIGDGVYNRPDSLAIFSSLKRICDKYGIIKDEWSGFNVLHNHASTVGALDIGFNKSNKSLSAIDMVKSVQTGAMSLLFLLGADEITIPDSCKGTIVYIGHHGDINAQKADIILPAMAFTEKDASYINNEGLLQHSFAAVKAPTSASLEYEIILELSKFLDIDLGYNNLDELRGLIYKHLIEKSKSNNQIKFSSKAKVTNTPIKTNEVNFYLSNSIARASKTMAACAHEFLEERVL